MDNSDYWTDESRVMGQRLHGYREVHRSVVHRQRSLIVVLVQQAVYNCLVQSTRLSDQPLATQLSPCWCQALGQLLHIRLIAGVNPVKLSVGKCHVPPE